MGTEAAFCDWVVIYAYLMIDYQGYQGKAEGYTIGASVEDAHKPYKRTLMFVKSY